MSDSMNFQTTTFLKRVLKIDKKATKRDYIQNTFVVEINSGTKPLLLSIFLSGY